jgi:hypothetical protein
MNPKKTGLIIGMSDLCAVIFVGCIFLILQKVDSFDSANLFSDYKSTPVPFTVEHQKSFPAGIDINSFVIEFRQQAFNPKKESVRMERKSPVDLIRANQAWFGKRQGQTIGIVEKI